MKIDVCKTNMN
nr:unnamed protein product [Callosobruchus analis]